MRLQGGRNPQFGESNKTQYGANPQGNTRDNMITNAMIAKGKLNPAYREVPKKVQPALNPQQIRAIKNSPKGVLPAFIQKLMKKGK